MNSKYTNISENKELLTRLFRVDNDKLNYLNKIEYKKNCKDTKMAGNKEILTRV